MYANSTNSQTEHLIDKAQEKQKKSYATKIQKSVKVFNGKVGDLVKKPNSTKKGHNGDTLARKWTGPYTLADISKRGRVH